MIHPITCLVGRRTGMGTITRAAHDKWALYVDFGPGWLRVPMREVFGVFGPETVRRVSFEAGCDLA